ncbi:class I SAM-dependent methyltransferase [Pseudozobellia thermophila]|uniref:class I SAM-dependent methyltransferase n=1 Tax=Pseudozobellia thermophila TaxID=192903 RepID=UPI00294FF204|nr:class I SAM-dependent methyltransferase [Pseudozobellia thermophila]
MSVLLKGALFDDVSNRELAEQLESRKKCQKKLPTWFRTPGIYYPRKLHIEQSSSETTARHKASITTGKSLVDLTGGFGVDSYFFSKNYDRVHHCETNPELSEIAAHNFQILGVDNITAIAQDGIEFLKTTSATFDCIYLDPSRRSESNQRVFRLSDCSPDVTEHLSLLFSKAPTILLKTAPLLDITMGLTELDHVKEIHIVAIENDVKELVWVMEREFEGDISIKTTNFTKTTVQQFDFNREDEKVATPKYSNAQNYLYEPNSAILKSGAFKTLAQRLDLPKLHRHTHLYTSGTPIDFPGRAFKVNTVIPYNKKAIKELQIKKANITTRNFPETVAQLRKKFRIRDGGSDYLFFTRQNEDDLVLIQCAKV